MPNTHWGKYMVLNSLTVRDSLHAIRHSSVVAIGEGYDVLASVLDGMAEVLEDASAMEGVSLEDIADILNDVVTVEEYRLAIDIKSKTKKALDTASMQMCDLVMNCYQVVQRELDKEASA